ncbi:MAG: hypothetical protein BWY56_02614 [Acidobacteria bacterium ADurb.Bin340]|nr:MAG: hypothetical protein BWY56_02614 [Acidobacteria bacterium ADurb.Bin340]
MQPLHQGLQGGAGPKAALPAEIESQGQGHPGGIDLGDEVEHDEGAPEQLRGSGFHDRIQPQMPGVGQGFEAPEQNLADHSMISLRLRPP